MATDEVVIHSSDSIANLTFIDPEINDAGEVEYFVAKIELPGVTAHTRIDASRNEELPKIFRKMAEQWKGWSGELSFETIDHDLILSATSDRTGHACVNITLSSYEPIWTVIGELRLDSNQYKTIAKELESFFRSRENA